MTLPSTRTIEAFVATARFGSLAAAGDQLGMSTSALSRRLSDLERGLGTRLLDRLPRGVALTAAGARYLEHAVAVLDRLRTAADELHRASSVVRVTTIPAFAARWLVPRLPDFNKRHPGVEVEVRTSTDYERLDDGAFDFAVRLARNDRIEERPLVAIHLLPVWNVHRSRPLEQPMDVLREDLIGPDHRPEFWAEWLNAMDIDKPIGGIRGVDPLLLYESTMNGSTVAIGIEPLVSDLLSQERLVGLTTHRVRSTRSFFLLHGKTEPPPAARLFERWLKGECEGDGVR